jgi:hypothetical protein
MNDKEIERLIGQMQYRNNQAIRARMHDRLRELWQRREAARASARTRLVITRGWTKIACAAAAVVLLGVLIGLLSRSGSPAYALEQTIAAARDICQFHFQFHASPGALDKEAWIEYDPNGTLRSVRVDFPTVETGSIMVWDRGITQYWSGHAQELWLFDDQEYTDKVLFFAHRYDPRQAIGHLQERVREGGIQVEVGQPSNAADPIKVTVTYDANTFLLSKPKPPMREVFTIDPVTKLILSVAVETLEKDHYITDGVYEYLDYGQPFRPGLFDLKREVPADANCSDTTGIPMGMEQGTLSKEEVAIKMVGAFLEAWAAKDYGRAAQIHGYVSTGEAKSLGDRLRGKNVVQVLSIGLPVIPERPLTGLLVPCTVEFEVNGITRTVRFEFRVSEGSQKRWRIRDFQQRELPPAQNAQASSTSVRPMRSDQPSK